MIGSGPVLGDWQPAAAIALSTSAETFPVWTGEVELQTGLNENKSDLLVLFIVFRAVFFFFSNRWPT